MRVSLKEALSMPKTILITGSSSGFGLAMVKKFLNAGWHVIATARHPENNEQLQQLKNSSLTLFTLDITNTDHRQNLKLFIEQQRV